MISFRDVNIDELSSKFPNSHDANTTRINFDLPGLQSKDYSNVETNSVEEVTAAEPEILAPDSVQESDSSVIK